MRQILMCCAVIGMATAVDVWAEGERPGPGPDFDRKRVVDTALSWKRMFEDPAYLASHREELEIGRTRFVTRYPGADRAAYKGYISGFYPLEKDGRFLPLTGMGCSRYTWAIFKSCFGEAVWPFINTEEMYDIIQPAQSATVGSGPGVYRARHEIRIRKKARLLGKDEAWIQLQIKLRDLFTPLAVGPPRPGDLVVWAHGPPLREKGHVGIVVDPDRRTYVGANGPGTGITLEEYEATGAPGGPWFLRWNGRAPTLSSPSSP